METQFEIHSHLEKKHYVDYYRCIWRRRLIWVIIYAVVGLLALLLRLADNEARWTMYGCALIVYAVWLYFRPWMRAAKTVKQECAFDGDDAVFSVTRFSDAVYDETKSQSVTVPYDKLAKIFITSNVIILEDVRKLDLIMDKHGFTKGSCEEFLTFIQEKCPQLKLPKW
jgi:hypothetical protein